MPHVCALLANLNSLVTDFVTRTKLTYLHLSYFVLKQIPVLPPEVYGDEALEFIVPRVLELTCVSNDLCAFATDVWHSSDERLQAAIRARWKRARDIDLKRMKLFHRLFGTQVDERRFAQNWMHIMLTYIASPVTKCGMSSTQRMFLVRIFRVRPFVSSRSVRRRSMVSTAQGDLCSKPSTGLPSRLASAKGWQRGSPP